MKNFSTYLRFVALTTLITLGIGQMWADDYYFRHWDANNNTHLVDRGSNVYSSYFILSGNVSFKIADSGWDNNKTFGKGSNSISLNTEYTCAKPGSDLSLNFSSNRAYFVRINTSTSKLLISTFVPSEAAPSAVVSGTNAMFYIQGYEGLNYLVNSSKSQASTTTPMNYTGISYVNTAKTNLSTYDRISNNPGGWEGDENTNIKNAAGGELFNRDGSKTAAKTAATTASVSGETLSISTTTNATTGVYGSLPLYIQYYIDGTFVGVTYNSSAASYGSIPAGGATSRASTFNVSSLDNGSHTLKTVLTDGIVFWVADTDNFTVAHSYSITYKDQGNVTYTGTNGNSLPASYTYGTGVTLVDGEKSGYTFGGWYDNSGCTGSAVTTISTTATGAKTFYAKWTAAATRTLTYHANYITTSGNGSGSVPAAQTVDANTSTTVANKNTLAFVNYTFQGWNTEEHITGTNCSVGSSITMDTDKDLYAVWTRPIPLDDQGATTAVTGDVYGTYNSSSLPSFTNPAKTGYTFQGWYTQIGGGGNFVINTSRVFQASKTNWTNASCQFIRPSTSTSSLYAKWTQTVTLKANTANHGSGTDQTATATWNKGTTVSISQHCAAATGYQLEGYYTDATGGTKIIKSDKSFAATNITNYITDSKWTKAGATTLYAHYTPISYTITYNLNSGTNPSGAPTSYTIESSTITLPTPTRAGYTFGGWYTSSDYTGSAVTTIATGTTGNKTYYAKWTEKMTTVTVNVSPAGAGTLTVGGSAFTAGNTTTAGVTTSRTVVATAGSNFVFSSWSVSGNATGTNSTNTYTLKGNGSAGTGTLTANFTAKPYYIAGESALGLNWDPDETAMTYNNDGTYYYTTPSLDANTEYSFKVTNGAWGTTNEIGNGSRDATHSENITFTSEDSGTGNVVFKCDNAGAVTIWCNPSTPAIWIVGTAPVPKTFSVTVPDCTPACYIRGSFNDWGSTAMTRDPNNANHFTLTVNACPDNVEYKYCAGTSWDYQEQDANGNDLANNRTYNANDAVARWASTPTDVAYSHTFTVTVPACTPSCYIAGSFNSWNTVAMTMVDATHYTYTVDCTNAATYKYASGDNMSSYYETDASGNGISDRVAVNCAMTDNVAKWHSKPAYPHTFTVTVPSCTPAVYFVSDVDNWVFHAMTRSNSTTYTYTVTCTDDAKYKYASGADWAYVEKDANGDEISDRIASDCAATDAIGTWRTPSFSLTPSSAQSIALPISGTQTATQSITAGSLEGTTAAQITWTLTTTGGAAVPSTDATISPASANATTTLTAKKTGTYRVTCTATNGCTSTSHYVDITATCATPSMTAGQTTFDILASGWQVVGPTSPSGISSYSWTIVSGTGGSFSSTTAQRPTFTPQLNADNVYTLRCTASNACGNSITQDYTVYAWQTMPKVTLNVTNSSGDSNWGTSTIYAYWYKDGSHNGFVPLTYSAGTWTGNIPKNTAELGYKIYICKEQNTSSAVRTYDSNEYGYVEIPAGNAYYKTYNLDIIPTKGTQQQFGLTERCESFTLQNSTFTLGNQSNISIAVSKKSDSPHNIPEGATYLWSCIQGLNGDDLLSSNTDAAPTFYKTRNGQTATGRYVFQVTVTNPRNTDCFAVALITIDCWAEKYYLKHAKSANNTNWGWDEMTYQGDGMYTCSAYYDGDDSNVGAKVSIDKKIRINARIGDLCNENSWHEPVTIHYWDGNGNEDDITVNAPSAYDGYQFCIPEGQSFMLKDSWFDSSNANTNMHKTYNYTGPVNDDQCFYIYSNCDRNDTNCDDGSCCQKTELSFSVPSDWVDGYPEGYVRYDGYRSKENILNHEHAAGTVLWVYNAATDELSISESGTYYRLASTVPAKSSTNFAGTAGKTYYSNGIKSTDIGNTAAALVSMYVAGGADVRLQESTNGGVTYSDVSSPAVGYAGPAADGVWNAHLSSTNNGATLDWSRYTGDYYLRSKGLLNNTANYKTANAKFVKFEPDRSNINEFYNNYWAGHLVKGENISAMVANDLNPCLSDELGSYYVGLGNYAPNIRYAYDTLTNHFSYSLLNGSTAGLEFLTVFGGLNVYDKAGSDKQLLTQANAEELSDQSNWVYVAEIYANANATVRLLGKYQKEYGGTPILNWLLGNGDNLVTLPVLTTNSPDDIRHLLVSYDFKTNKIVVGWIPEGDNINANITLEGNLILRRENNQDVKTFSLATNKTITGLERAYFNFILKPDRYTYTDDDGVERTFVNPNTDGLTAEHNIYWFSLPFDCEVKDIFGIAGYGTDWVIQRYRGDARAHYSWTSNISTFWRNVPLTYTLKAGEGYALVFKAANIKFSAITVDETTTVQNSIFFPSKNLIGNVTDQAATATYPEIICTAQNGLRKAEDSNWQVIGPITYERTVDFSSYTPSSSDHPSAAGETYPNFLYVFDNDFQKSQGNNNPITAYSVQNGRTFTYKGTYSYMTQYAGTINWQSAASSVTSNNAPRRRVNGQNEQVQGTNHRESYEIQLITNTDTLDHTYVVLATGSDADFMPGEDLYKFSEGGKSVVYTEASEKPAAGNALPYQSQEVPVTVNLAESGDYTFALDGDIDGTTGVQLVDNADGVTTDLRQYSYSATLPAGETRGRFTLIFTIDAGQHGGQTTGLTDLYENTLVRVVDGRIVVDGMPAGAALRLYDATGKLIYGAKSQEQGTKNSWQSAPLPQGVYMLRIGNHTTKVVL